MDTQNIGLGQDSRNSFLLASKDPQTHSPHNGLDAVLIAAERAHRAQKANPETWALDDEPLPDPPPRPLPFRKLEETTPTPAGLFHPAERKLLWRVHRAHVNGCGPKDKPRPEVALYPGKMGPYGKSTNRHYIGELIRDGFLVETRKGPHGSRVARLGWFGSLDPGAAWMRAVEARLRRLGPGALLAGRWRVAGGSLASGEGARETAKSTKNQGIKSHSLASGKAPLRHWSLDIKQSCPPGSKEQPPNGGPVASQSLPERKAPPAPERSHQGGGWKRGRRPGSRPMKRRKPRARKPKGGGLRFTDRWTPEQAGEFRPLVYQVAKRGDNGAWAQANTYLRSYPPDVLLRYYREATSPTAGVSNPGGWLRRTLERVGH